MFVALHDTNIALSHALWSCALMMRTLLSSPTADVVGDGFSSLLTMMQKYCWHGSCCMSQLGYKCQRVLFMWQSSHIGGGRETGTGAREALVLPVCSFWPPKGLLSCASLTVLTLCLQGNRTTVPVTKYVSVILN